MNDANQLTFDMLMPEDFQTSTFSFSDGLAKIIRLLENDSDKEKELEAAYYLKPLESCGLNNPVILSLKTFQGYFPSMTDETSTKQFDCLPTWGMTLSGNYLIQGGFSPKIESGFSLSDILEDCADEEYFLSLNSIGYLANHAAKRGRYLLVYERNSGGLTSRKFTSSSQVEEYAERQSWSVSVSKAGRTNGTTNAKKPA